MEKASKNNNYHYNKKLKEYADANKKTMTKAAACMWKYLLSKRQMRGYQFRRERPILNYIADFVCLELLLVIEVDGITHLNEEVEKRDGEKDKAFTKIGFTVLRFTNWEVLNRIEIVGEVIANWIEENATISPNSRRRERKSRDDSQVE